MKAEVAQKLLDLNRDFYESLAAPFAETRAAPQPGFKRLLAAQPVSPCRLLDVGCGNGRFGHFLAHHDALAHYTGVDFSDELLAAAAARVPGDYHRRDLSRPDCLAGLGQHDLVACLAVLQHIPGAVNRLHLLRQMGDCLRPDGRLFLSTWQFMDSQRQRRKLRDWATIGLSAADVEPGDHLLTWQRGGFGLRYVCAVGVAETAVLAGEADLRILAQFRSDGREGDLNLYTILERG